MPTFRIQNGQRDTLFQKPLNNTNPLEHFQFFDYNEDNQNKQESNTIINSISDELKNITDKKGFFTINLSSIENIIYNQINENNIVEILSDYQSANGKNLLEEICSYKCASNNKRKSLLLDLVDKLEKANQNVNNDVSALVEILKDEINYQFDKFGFIDTLQISSLFEVLVEKAETLPAQIEFKKAEEFDKEFLIEELAPTSQKRENIGRYRIDDREFITGKEISYDMDDGRRLLEVYHYDNNNKEFILDNKIIYNGENIEKSASYSPNGNLIQAYYNSGDENESETYYYFRNDGVIYQKYLYTKTEAQCITVGKNNKIALNERYKRDLSDGHFLDSNSQKYDSNGVPQTTYYPYWTLGCYLDNPKECDKNILKRMWNVTKDNLDMEWVADYPGWTKIEDYGLRYTVKMMRYVQNICNDLAQERNIDITDLSNQFEALMKDNTKESIIKAHDAILLPMVARVTNMGRFHDPYLFDFDKHYVNYAPANGKLDQDFKQGHFGSCWLTCTIKSFEMTPEGQNLLKEIVTQDPITKEIVVTLKGAPEGQQVYRYTQEQIDQASELSNGEGDARAIEMAVRDYFMIQKSDKKYHQYNINGHYLHTALEILSGKKYEEQYFFNSLEDEKTDEQKEELMNYLKSIANKGNVIGNCSFTQDVDWPHLYTGHAYTFCRVDDRYVYIVNPWNTSCEINILIEDFVKYCFEIDTVEL